VDSGGVWACGLLSLVCVFAELRSVCVAFAFAFAFAFVYSSVVCVSVDHFFPLPPIH